MNSKTNVRNYKKVRHTKMKCTDCGKSLDAEKWGAYQRCYECHWKHEKELPEGLWRTIRKMALAVDLHAGRNHDLEPGKECAQCLNQVWNTFCQLRGILAMGDTWTYFQRVTAPSDKDASKTALTCPKCGVFMRSGGPAYRRTVPPQEAYAAHEEFMKFGIMYNS